MHKTVDEGPLGFLCSGFALYYALDGKSLLAGRNVAGHSHRTFFFMGAGAAL